MAAITGFSGLFGAVAGGWAAVQQQKHSGGATIKVAVDERAALFQMHRREKYGVLLDVVHRAGADDLDVAAKLAEALLVANRPLRERLMGFNGPGDLREQLQDVAKYRALVEAMSADVQVTESS